MRWRTAKSVDLPRAQLRLRANRRGLALYPAAMDSCFVDGQLVRPQPGGFYGGWITDELVGPFKGIPGSMGW